MSEFGSAVCPHCGTDLKRFEPVEVGHLRMDIAEVWWKGQRVPLTTQQRLIVMAVARGRGCPISYDGLANAAGVSEEALHPRRVVYLQTFHTRQSFKAIDPTFRSLESVSNYGLRWAD